VEQGSLRFDFTHFKALTTEELVKVEKMVNDWIMMDLAVTTDIKDLNAAKTEGATALFGEKYGDKVRVVTMSPVSKELCGGTHVSSTGQIGAFHIMEETSISAGVRRIIAISGAGVVDYILAKEKTIASLTATLKVGEDKLFGRMEALLDTVKKLEDQVKQLSIAKAAGVIDSLIEEAQTKTGSFPWLAQNLGTMDKDSFTMVADAISDTIKNKNLASMVVLIGAQVEGKVLFAASAGPDAVKKFGLHCGELVKAAAQKAGGGGGGSPVRAQAGGKDPSCLDEAIRTVSTIITSKASGS
jgi:alanyl-tRNA synthetase